jgi:hypothetical protein
MKTYMARRVPALRSLSKTFLGLRKFENRIMYTVLWTIVGLLSIEVVQAKDPNTLRTLQFLQMGFPEKSESMQKNLLRDMALLDSEEAIPFFVGVAMDSNYTEETRREALKGMLAVDSTQYRMVLDILQTSPIDEGLLLKHFQTIPGLDLMRAFMTALTFQEDIETMDVKLTAILRVWDDQVAKSFDYSAWPSDKASSSLGNRIVREKRTEYRVNLIYLWSRIRDEKSTKELVKLLDQPNARVQEAVILALSEPGPTSVSALGRFLQKSKDATLRKRTIYALRKINTTTSKAALKSYEPRATKEEKEWIKEILQK